MFLLPEIPALPGTKNGRTISAMDMSFPQAQRLLLKAAIKKKD
jgi:hypothetical protein